MATIQATDVADLVTTSLNDLGRLRWTDIASTYQNTIAMKRLIRKQKTVFDSGPEASFNLMTDVGDSARWVGLGEPDVVDIKSVMTTGKVGWRHITWNYAFDFREPLMNSGAAKIVDLIKTRRYSELGSAIIKFEQAFWRVPALTDVKTMFGLPYYVVKSNTATTTLDGFNGTVPSGYTVVANISPTTYNRWRNYATQYTAVSKDDLIRKARRLRFYTDFMPLVDNTPEYDLGSDYGQYTNYSVVGALEEILESQNENLGTDVASMDGKTMLGRSPVTPVKELDLDTTNPLYFINWSKLGVMGLRGAWMVETTIPKVGGQHTMTAIHTDCSLNLLCYDRRAQGVLATNTTMDY